MFGSVKLEGAKSKEAQANIKLWDVHSEEPYELVHVPGAWNGATLVEVESSDGYLGYLPQDSAVAVVKKMLDGEKWVAKFARTMRNPGSEVVYLIVDLHIDKRKKRKMSDSEYIEAKEWQQKWIDRHGSSKWY